MDNLTRRGFIAGGAGTLALLAAGAACSDEGDRYDGLPPDDSVQTTVARTPLPDPEEAPFDTVVVLMMENRSFDHVLGWLPGSDGIQEGLEFVDQAGATHATYALAPDWQGCSLQDPDHSWQGMATQLNGGACDGFLKTQPTGDLFPVGYYVDGDLPILAALAKGYTTFDQYFASMLGPTWPNRLYQLSATTDLTASGLFPQPVAPGSLVPAPGATRPVQLETAIFDRLRDADLTGSYYTWGEPMTGLYANGRYDELTLPIERFWEDAAAGTLANVTFVDPDYTTRSELTGTSNDYHPYGSVQDAEAFVAQVHDALKDSPQWERMVFVLNFDEGGGFYDHVAPPTADDETVLPGDGPQPDLTQLGFRVPAIAMGPFAPQRIETAGPYEHCSILRMVEWRWGLEPMTVRDANARNLAEALDLTTTRDAITLPSFTPAATGACTT
jgi:phospholipase C